MKGINVMKRITSLLLAVFTLIGCLSLTPFAAEDSPISVEYENVAYKEKTWAAHELVPFEGEDAMKLTPNIAESSGKAMQIRGTSYSKLGVELSEYNWVAVRYYYESPKPVDASLGITIKNKGDMNLDKALWEDKGRHMYVISSPDKLETGKWAYAVMNIGEIVKPAFKAGTDKHIMNHIDIYPFGSKKIGTDITENDIFYIDKVIFYKNKPIVTKEEKMDIIEAGTELGFAEPDSNGTSSDTSSNVTVPSAPSAEVKVEAEEITKVFSASGAIVIDFADYHNGTVNGQDTATVENVVEDGKKAAKIVPNNKAQDSTTMKIEGYRYKGANIDVGKFKWAAIEYKYVSPSPMSTTMAIHIKNNGDILDPKHLLSATADSSWRITEGVWTVAIFNIENTHQYLREGKEAHILNQMHLLPFNAANVTKSSGSDVFYIGRLAFLPEKPDIASAAGIKCNIDFDGGHPAAEGEMPTQTVDFESEITLPSCSFTVMGLEFAGWRCSQDSKIYNAGDTVTVTNESVVFSAQWKRGDNYKDFISLKFADYEGGIVINHKTAILEDVLEDGKSALKIVPIPTSPDSHVIKIEGTAYGGLGIDLGVYKWAAIEYKYVSDNPGTYKPELNIKMSNNILKEEFRLKATPAATEPMTTGGWKYAIIDLAMVEEMLNPNASAHEIRQMHVLPFGSANLKTLNANDALYISNLMFFKEKPKFDIFESYITGYNDGTFKPSNTMTRAEACTVIARILEKEANIKGTSDFADVADTDWFAKYIGFCREKGLLPSYSGNFLPNQAITRAEFAELVYLTSLAEDKGNATAFTDVAESHPKYASIKAAASAGLINGYLEADGTYTFRPDNTITRAEVVTVINRARGTSRKGDFIGSEITIAFVDVDRSHWAFGDIVVASVPHAEVDGKWLHASLDVLANISSKIDPALFFDTAAGNAKVAELDALEAKRIEEIRSTPSMTLNVSGTKYYVSALGSDDNDGKSEATPFKTVNKAASTVKSGDAILIRRGDLFRERFAVAPGVTVTAYGEGAKPVICGSPENGADSAKWTLDYEDAATGAKIWKYSNTGMTDIGNIIFNEGEKYAWKDNPAKKDQNGNVYVMALDKTKPYDYKVSLNVDLKFFHDASSVGDITFATGPVYLRCDAGNPGEIFDSIEFSPRGNAIGVRGDDVTIDNLCIKYTGSHGIGAGTVKNLLVTNCELGWIGGSAQTFRNAGSMTRFGNGVEIYGGCENYRVENCYIYQCYDAGVTHQYDANGADIDIEMLNVAYRNNLITECVYSIEYFLNDSITRKRVGKDILFENNICRRAGYGFGSTRPNGYSQRHIRCTTAPNPFSNFVVRNNIFDRSVYELFQTTSNYGSGVPVYEGNTYITGVDNQLFTSGIGKGTTYKADIGARSAVATGIGDTTGTIYFVENIPYYQFPHSSK